MTTQTVKGYTLQITSVRVTILKDGKIVDYAGNLDQALHIVDTLEAQDRRAIAQADYRSIWVR